jgi:hypothetical protein
MNLRFEYLVSTLYDRDVSRPLFGWITHSSLERIFREKKPYEGMMKSLSGLGMGFWRYQQLIEFKVLMKFVSHL